MQWPMPWLEALGLLAVVFAAGTGIGFGLSRLSGPLTLGKARPASRPQRTSRTAPQPARAVTIAEAPQLDAPQTNEPLANEPLTHEPLTNAPAETESAPKAAAPLADSPKPETVVTAPAGPAPHLALTMRVRYSVNPLGNTLGNPFGALSVTRPNPDQPSS